MHPHVRPECVQVSKRNVELTAAHLMAAAPFVRLVNMVVAGLWSICGGTYTGGTVN